MSSQELKFPKATKLSEILIWYIFVTPNSLSLILNLFTSNFCAVCWLSDTLQNFYSHQVMITNSVSTLERSYIEYTCMPYSMYQYVIDLIVTLPIRIDLGVFRMFRCGNILLLNTRHFYMVEFTTLTPLSLLSSCKLSFPVVGFNIYSFPSFALKSTNRMWYLGEWWKTCSNSS